MSINKKEEFNKAALEYIDSLYRLSLYATADENDAQNLVQKAYLRAYISFDEYRADTNFRSWLFGILNGEFINSCYGKTGKIKIDQLGTGSLSALIGGLPPESRMVVLLADMEDIPCEEVAEIIGCSEEETIARLCRGRRLIKKELLARNSQSDKGRRELAG